MRGEEDPLLRLPGLSREVSHSTGGASPFGAWPQAVSTPPVTATDLCLSRQEEPSQPLLKRGIYALTHKHTAREHNIKQHRNAVALSLPATLLQGQLCHAGRTRGHAGQQNIKGSKLFSDCFVYCASGFWLGGVVILSRLPWAVKAIKAFVLDWCLGKSDPVLGLLLYQVCQVVRYTTCGTLFFFFPSPLSPYPSYST